MSALLVGVSSRCHRQHGDNSGSGVFAEPDPPVTDAAPELVASLKSLHVAGGQFVDGSRMRSCKWGGSRRSDLRAVGLISVFQVDSVIVPYALNGAACYATPKISAGEVCLSASDRRTCVQGVGSPTWWCLAT